MPLFSAPTATLRPLPPRSPPPSPQAKKNGLTFLDTPPALLRRQLNSVPQTQHVAHQQQRPQQPLPALHACGMADAALTGYFNPHRAPEHNHFPAPTAATPAAAPAAAQASPATALASSAFGLAPLASLGFGMGIFFDLLSHYCEGHAPLSAQILDSLESLFSGLPLFAFSEVHAEASPPLSFPFALPYPVSGVEDEGSSLLKQVGTSGGGPGQGRGGWGAGPRGGARRPCPEGQPPLPMHCIASGGDVCFLRRLSSVWGSGTLPYAPRLSPPQGLSLRAPNFC